MRATIAQLLAQAATALRRAGLQHSRQEARWLLQDALDLDWSDLILRADQEVEPSDQARYLHWVERRCQREPLGYISGRCQFWGREFHLNRHVLIPRPETELLVEHTLTVLRGEGKQPLILDLCCGSGVIAITLALELGACLVVASDLSLPALELARRNVQRHAPQSVFLVCGDLFAGLLPCRRFDCIVSNPPYVRSGEIDRLQAEVSQWEPRLALDGGADGMRCIHRIGRQAGHYLRPGGLLFLEIGADQQEACLEFFSSLPAFDEVGVLKDLAGKPRILQARTRRAPWTKS